MEKLYKLRHLMKVKTKKIKIYESQINSNIKITNKI
jgi:hypothetical protein